jgi:hypothetical protein
MKPMQKEDEKLRDNYLKKNNLSHLYKPEKFTKKGSEQMQLSLLNELKIICQKYGYKLTELSIEEL